MNPKYAAGARSHFSGDLILQPYQPPITALAIGNKYIQQITPTRMATPVSVEFDATIPRMSWAVENGITKGTDATHFSPDLELTTAHIITFLYRTKNTGKDGWYQEAANWAVEGYGGKPFGVDTVVNDMTYCPRAYVVMFLQKAK